MNYKSEQVSYFEKFNILYYNKCQVQEIFALEEFEI